MADYEGNLVRIYIVQSLLYSLLTIAAFTVNFHGIHFKDGEAPHDLLRLQWKCARTRRRRSGLYGKRTAITETDISERHYVGGW